VESEVSGGKGRARCWVKPSEVGGDPAACARPRPAFYATSSHRFPFLWHFAGHPHYSTGPKGTAELQWPYQWPWVRIVAIVNRGL
jgi:hypothetical protein